MFDLLDRPRVWYPVKFPGLVPGPDNGPAVAVEHEIELLFDIMDRDDFNTVFTVEEGAPSSKSVDDFKKIAFDWRGIIGNGKPLPFSDEYIGAFLQRPNVTEAVAVAYIAAFQGKAEIRSGNSEGRPGDGQAAAPSRPTSETAA